MSSFTLLRLISWIEGISFLLLLGSMVPKYAWDQPGGVHVLGPIHGGLFVLFLMALSICPLPIKRRMLVGLLSIVPFGFIPIDRIILHDTPQPE